ncbi:MAG TPA: hypothetical protein VGF20_03000 [Candidatus Acidoferrum sp.]|jgi:hypothetical protein
MNMTRALWHCTNHSCNAEVVVQAEDQSNDANPRCACGAPLKKKYTSPVFRYLDFLRLDEPVEVGHGVQKVAEE